MPAEPAQAQPQEPAAAPAFLQPNPALAAVAEFARRLSSERSAFPKKHHPQLPRPWAVAYSGGADSTALLHAACALWPGQIRALHVHHGLQAAADGFARQCEQVCAKLSVPLQVLRVRAQPQPGQSPEDAARQARYLALAEAARGLGCSLTLLGQHADDQAETVMLALGRGAGLPGLAAMPELFERHGLHFGRPLLALPAAGLRQWLMDQGLGFVDDPTNQDLRFSRNLLRQRLMPALAEVLPHYRQTLARSARHAAQAQQLLDEVATQDLTQVGCPPRLRELQALSTARQANVLRHWLAGTHGVRPSAAQLDELLAQVAACTTRGHRIELKVASGRVMRQGPELVFYPG